jgi:hypothetical protein
MELLVGMVISSIVISLAYSAYNILTIQFLEYKKTCDRTQEQALGFFLLKKDLDRCCSVKKVSDNELEMDYKDKAIRYKWTNDKLTRTAGLSTDTFFIGVKTSVMSFGNAGATVNGIVDRLSITTVVDGKTFSISVKKRYGSDVLMEQKEDQENQN